MAKGWVTLETVNDRPKETKTHRIKKDICRKVEKKTLEQLKKEGDELAEIAKFEEEKLLEAFKAKRVKSKEAIKKAKSIIAAREKKEKKQKVEEVTA